MEEGLVADVHADGDSRLTPVTAEASFSDEDPQQEAQFQLGRAIQVFRSAQSASRSCYTVW